MTARRHRQRNDADVSKASQEDNLQEQKNWKCRSLTALKRGFGMTALLLVARLDDGAVACSASRVR